jgi:AAA family ATP:ADP antiporter
LVAVVALLTNWVNTNGENLLFRVVQERLEGDVVAQGVTGEAAVVDFVREGTTAFYGSFAFWVNVVALVLQALVASRLLRYGGFGAILLLLPTIALMSYTAMALVPVLAVVRVMKIAENSTDYSINNTARQVLWLPTTSEMKYRAKPAIDSLFVRVGDGLAALTALIGVQVLALTTRSFFVLNVALAVAWVAVASAIVREHRRLTPAEKAAALG